MPYSRAGLLTIIACAATFGRAAAQHQASFSRWTVPLPVASARAPASTLADSVRQKVGYQHWKGAAIGAGIGAVLGSVLAFGVVGECDDCTRSTWDRAQGALIITGASSVFGFLVGLATPRYAWRASPTLSVGE